MAVALSTAVLVTLEVSPALAETTPTPTSTSAAAARAGTSAVAGSGTTGTSTTKASDPSTTTTTKAPPPTSGTTSRPSTSTSSTTPPKPVPTGSGDSESTLTPAELAAQIARAEQLRADLAKSNSALAAVLTKLDTLAAQSNRLLEKYAAAKDVEAAALLEAERNQALSAQLTAQLAHERDQLRTWAFYAYSEGGSVAEMAGILGAMGKDPATSGNPVGDLSYLTNARGQAFATIDALSKQQADATYRAEAASKEAQRAAKEAAAAKTDAAAVVADQKAQLEALRKTHAAEIAKAGPLVQVLAGARTPEATAAYRALVEEMARAGQSPTSVGATCSHDEATYPNGMLPAAALCPLWKAPGERLRPSAAAAYNAMSAAYAKDTGTPLCVTDSYRSLSEQVSVKARRGVWAASPGTSPHGLGIALDLCGGVNSFGTPAYEWMKQNGPIYGWYHPSWAEPGASLPEPWHWQFAG